MLKRALISCMSATFIVTAFVILTGMKSCSPAPAEPGECFTAAECKGHVQPNCVGEWSCVDSQCLFTCEPTPSVVRTQTATITNTVTSPIVSATTVVASVEIGLS